MLGNYIKNYICSKILLKSSGLSISEKILIIANDGDETKHYIKLIIFSDYLRALVVIILSHFNE